MALSSVVRQKGRVGQAHGIARRQYVMWCQSTEVDMNGSLWLDMRSVYCRPFSCCELRDASVGCLRNTGCSRVPNGMRLWILRSDVWSVLASTLSWMTNVHVGCSASWCILPVVP